MALMSIPQMQQRFVYEHRAHHTSFVNIITHATCSSVSQKKNTRQRVVFSLLVWWGMLNMITKHIPLTCGVALTACTNRIICGGATGSTQILIPRNDFHVFSQRPQDNATTTDYGRQLCMVLGCRLAE